jgi:hypothetical protein
MTTPLLEVGTVTVMLPVPVAIWINALSRTAVGMAKLSWEFCETAALPLNLFALRIFLPEGIPSGWITVLSEYTIDTSPSTVGAGRKTSEALEDAGQITSEALEDAGIITSGAL